MKQLSLIIAFICTMFMSSCSNKSDSIIHATKTEQSGWVVETPGQNPVMKYDTYYQISPTWGQSIHYAYKTSDHAIAVFISLVLFIAFCVLFVGKTSDAKWMPKSFENSSLFSAILFILLVGSVYAWYNKPGNIRFNNDKWVKKEVYDKAIKEAGSTQPIWDSLEIHNLIVDGPYK